MCSHTCWLEATLFFSRQHHLLNSDRLSVRVSHLCVYIIDPLVSRPTLMDIGLSTQDSCRNVLVENLWIRNSDDGVCIKSGLNGFGLNLAIPTENVLIRNITCAEGGRGENLLPILCTLAYVAVPSTCFTFPLLHKPQAQVLTPPSPTTSSLYAHTQLGRCNSRQAGLQSGQRCRGVSAISRIVIAFSLGSAVLISSPV